MLFLILNNKKIIKKNYIKNSNGLIDLNLVKI